MLKDFSGYSGVVKVHLTNERHGVLIVFQYALFCQLSGILTLVLIFHLANELTFYTEDPRLWLQKWRDLPNDLGLDMRPGLRHCK